MAYTMKDIASGATLQQTLSFFSDEYRLELLKNDHVGFSIVGFTISGKVHAFLDMPIESGEHAELVLSNIRETFEELNVTRYALISQTQIHTKNVESKAIEAMSVVVGDGEVMINETYRVDRNNHGMVIDIVKDSCATEIDTIGIISTNEQSSTSNKKAFH